MFNLQAPVCVQVSKKTKVYLNLNVYRNAHFQSLNKAKQLFKELMLEQIEPLPIMQGATIRYVLFVGTKRLCDVANVCSVVDKFFLDALVESGKLPDDNYEHVPKVTYEFGGYDKNAPRVEIYIEEIK